MSERMRGVVIRLLPNKGYGFIRDETGHSRFIHAKNFIVPGTFDTLREGTTLEFTPISEAGPSDGLRGIDIEVVSEC